MSRGYGKWERAILETLDRVPAFYLIDLLPNRHKRSQVVALNRAARKLCGIGMINTMSWLSRSHGTVTIYRVGYPMPSREQVTRLKRPESCTGPIMGPMQHLPRRRTRQTLDDVEWHRIETEIESIHRELDELG